MQEFNLRRRKRKTKNRAGQLFLLAIVLQNLKFSRISTGLKSFTAYLIFVAKFLSFIVKFIPRLPSIYDGELRQKHP